MSIQNNINSILGQAAGAAAMGKHLIQQGETIKQQEINNELSKLNATDKAIKDYKESGERVINNLNERNSIMNDTGLTDEQKAEAIEKLQLEGNELKLKMGIQDKSWNLLGVDKEDLKKLNSLEDQQRIHNFKRGEYDLDVAQMRRARTDKIVAASQPNGYGLNTSDLIELRKKELEGEYNGD